MAVNDDVQTDFVGTGWSFPPSFNLGQGTVDMATGEEDIRQSLQIIFSTRLGERIMNPRFGCSLQETLFEPMNSSLIAYLQNLIETAILYHEPRIDAESVIVENDATEGRLLIVIDYKIRGTNSRFNFVYPFYLQEASG